MRCGSTTLQTAVRAPIFGSIQISRQFLQKLSEKSRRCLRCCPMARRNGTFRSICLPYTDQIHHRSVTRPPFRTVSLGTSVNKAKSKDQGSRYPAGCTPTAWFSLNGRSHGQTSAIRISVHPAPATSRAHPCVQDSPRFASRLPRARSSEQV